MKNQNNEIAETCYQAIINTTDIKINSLQDEKMLISVIAATIEGIRKRQHEATKASVYEIYEEYNGLDSETLDIIEIPSIVL